MKIKYVLSTFDSNLKQLKTTMIYIKNKLKPESILLRLCIFILFFGVFLWIIGKSYGKI